jgi:hypothetical protein
MYGDRPPVKLFLSRHAGVCDRPNAVMELINQEIVLRQMRGETPCPDNYLIDFPDLAEPLPRLFEVHGALSMPPELRARAELVHQNRETSESRSEVASAPRVPGYEIQGILGRAGGSTGGISAEKVTCSLGQVYVNWSGMLHAIGRENDAIVKADAGIAPLDAHLRNEPLDEAARQLCLKLHGNRAYALGSNHYNLACLCALFAVAACNNTQLPPDQRVRLAEAHIADALRWLKEAAKTGFFRDPANRKQARNDNDLAILIERDEFRRLIERDAVDQ